MLEISGIARSIDTSSLILEIPAHLEPETQQPRPAMGEQVRLELSLPSDPDNARPKYLAVRARVTHIQELKDGSREVTFSFRRASFKDRVEGAAPKPPKTAGKGWRM